MGRRELNDMERIFLEYSSILLFGSFNEENVKFIILF